MAKNSSAAATALAPAAAQAMTRRENVEPQPVQQSKEVLQPDRLIHERIRLGIVSALAVNDCLSFGDLRKLLGTTDGNVSVHARKLEDAGYVSCTKSFEGRMPRTEYRLSEPGRKALDKYLNHMESLIRAMRAER